MKISDFRDQVGFGDFQVGLHSTTTLPQGVYQEENDLDLRLNISAAQFIDAIDPSVSLRNCLESENYFDAQTAHDFLKLTTTDLLGIRNLGRIPVKELLSKLETYFQRENIELNQANYPLESLGYIIVYKL